MLAAVCVLFSLLCLAQLTSYVAQIRTGLGTVLHLLLENIPSPEVSGILFDQESVIEKARTKWADDPLRNRTTFIAGTNSSTPDSLFLSG
jgi:hypothetical protein